MKPNSRIYGAAFEHDPFNVSSSAPSERCGAGEGYAALPRFLFWLFGFLIHPLALLVVFAARLSARKTPVHDREREAWYWRSLASNPLDNPWKFPYITITDISMFRLPGSTTNFPAHSQQNSKIPCEPDRVRPDSAEAILFQNRPFRHGTITAKWRMRPYAKSKAPC